MKFGLFGRIPKPWVQFSRVLQFIPDKKITEDVGGEASWTEVVSSVEEFIL
jgi:hypothetical protein